MSDSDSSKFHSKKQLSQPDPTTPHRGLPETASFVSREENERSFEPRRFGDYELMEEIAHGGMGVVFKARQVRLNRIVALKMILAGPLAGLKEMERFHAEATAASSLDHPGIVPVFEFGERDGQHYYSMGYIDGKTLKQYVDGKRPKAKRVAEWMATIADAIAYAHEKGVIHRDLKPSNILIDASGQVRVSDFGLAKLVDANNNLTRSGDVLGTPSYMPPEQAAGKTEAVGPAADVYGIGGILYELLTARPPFDRKTAMETVRAVIEEEPVAPRALEARVDRDLETICLKCLEKEPTLRYGSAKEVADELRRYLNLQPILARPISIPRRMIRWCRRRPWIASLSGIASVAGLLAILIATFAAETWKERETFRNQSAILSKDVNRLATEFDQSKNFHTYVGDLKTAHEGLKSGDANHAAHILRRYADRAPGESGPAVRSFEWYYLNGFVKSKQRLNIQRRAIAYGFSPDGDLIAISSSRRIDPPPNATSARGWRTKIECFETSTGELYREFSYDADTRGLSLQLILDPKLDRIAASDQRGTVRLWRLSDETSKIERTIKANESATTALAFAAGGTEVVTADSDSIKFFKLANGEWARTIPLESEIVSHVVCNTKSSRVAHASDSKVVRVWNGLNGKELARYEHGSPIMSIAFDPAGEVLACATLSEVVIRSLSDGGIVKTLSLELPRKLSFNADGTVLGCVSGPMLRHSTAFRLFDVRSGQMIGLMWGSDGNFAFGPLANEVCQFQETSVRLFDLVPSIQFIRSPSQSFAIDPDNDSATLVDRQARVWRADARGRLREYPLPPAYNRTVQGPYCAWTSGRKVNACNLNDPANIQSFPGDGFRLSPQGEILCGGHESITLRDLKTGSVLAEQRVVVPLWIRAVAFDGKRVAWRDKASKRVHVRNLVAGTQTVTESEASWDDFVHRTMPAPALTFSPDGKRLATAGHEGVVWESESGKRLFGLHDTNYIYQSVFSPDGKWIASLGNEGLRVWSLDDGIEKFSVFARPIYPFRSAAFTPDSRRIAIGAATGHVELWDVATGVRLLRLEGFQDLQVGGIVELRFRPNGSALVGRHVGGHVIRWNAPLAP